MAYGMKAASSYLRTLAAAGALVISQGAAALPTLQLWGEDASWENTTKAWIVNEPTGPFSVTALATDRHEGSNKGNAFKGGAGSATTAFLSFAIVRDSGFDGSEDTSMFGDIDVDGSIVSSNWAFGRPPVGSNDNLPDQGIYPTWFSEYEFDFGGFGDEVFNAKGNASTYLDVIDTGYRVDFAVAVSGFSMNTDDNWRIHIDLYTRDNLGGVHKLSPGSRDYEVVLAYHAVPAPSPVFFLLFGLGAMLAVRKLRAA